MIEVTKRTNDKKLPQKFSAGIYMALRDLEKAEKDPDFMVNMFTWAMRKKKGRPCEVCFGGAVMVGTLGVELPDRASSFALGSFDDETFNKIGALDTLRKGILEDAFHQYTGSTKRLPAKVMKSICIGSGGFFLAIPYSMDPKGFKLQMRKVAKALKDAGL